MVKEGSGVYSNVLKLKPNFKRCEQRVELLFSVKYPYEVVCQVVDPEVGECVIKLILSLGCVLYDQLDSRDTRANSLCELVTVNLQAWSGNKDVFPVSSSLDSSIKKNTAFIKRLRTGISGAVLNTFIQEIRSLSLHKYLSEIIVACYDGLCRLKTVPDIAAGVEIVCALHQRFGPSDFTRHLALLIVRGLAARDRSSSKVVPPDLHEKEDKERLARQKVLLRVATELWLVGVLRYFDDVHKWEETIRRKDGNPLSTDAQAKHRASTFAYSSHRSDALDSEPVMYKILKDLLDHDKKHVNLPLAVIFVKSYSWDVLGIKSWGNNPTSTDSANAFRPGQSTNIPSKPTVQVPEVNDTPLVPPELGEKFKVILIKYFKDVKLHLINGQEAINTQSRQNAEAYVRSGEVFEDRQANFEKQVKVQEKLIAHAQVLADAFNLEMPVLRGSEVDGNNGDNSIGLVKSGEFTNTQVDGAGIWEDEDERKFYEKILDLRDRVPIGLLEPKKKKGDDDLPSDKLEIKENIASPVNDNTSLVGQPESDDHFDADNLSKLGENEDSNHVTSGSGIVNKSIGAQVDGLLARLPDMTTREAVDNMACQFMFVNSKASKNRLVRALQDIPKGRADLLPFYARLVATLKKYMPDISSSLVTYLDEEFKSLQRRKQKDFLGPVRLMNVRYIAELTKFGAVPVHIIFHCLRVCMNDFSRMNIEIMATLMENCGRYLLRNVETSARMVSFLEMVQRKAGAQHLGQQERMIIENACYYVNPPEQRGLIQKDRSPMELFIRKLVYMDLKLSTLEKITKQIRKLHWEEREVVQILFKVFTKPHRLKYNNIHLLAVMLGTLNRYHPDFVISVIDYLIESIMQGLELKDVKCNQRRVAEVKYLAELYIYRMVDSSVIFTMLYRIICHGYEGGFPIKGYYNELDPPGDFFRVSLICTILETCGVYYSKGTAKKRLEFFLIFFQYYIFTKEPLPVDIEIVVRDILVVSRVNRKLSESLEDATKQFIEAVREGFNSQVPLNINKPESGNGNVALGKNDAEDSSTGDDEDLATDEVLLRGSEAGGTGGGENEEMSEDEEELEEECGDIVMENRKSEELDGSDNEDQNEDDDEEDNDIYVVRREDEGDTELEAEFDRELGKLMTEILDSRKSERKPIFDVPLPMRRLNRESNSEESNAGGFGGGGGGGGGSGGVTRSTDEAVVKTMKFSLLSKKGNKQMTKTIDLPSDSSLALAMRNYQQAEKEEQQRIKNLVLNYDLANQEADCDASQSVEKMNATFTMHQRSQKSSSGRNNGRARKLQLSDVDW